MALEGSVESQNTIQSSMSCVVSGQRGLFDSGEPKEKRNAILSGYLCGKETESNSHLFVHCESTGKLWQLFLDIKGQPGALELPLCVGSGERPDRNCLLTSRI